MKMVFMDLSKAVNMNDVDEAIHLLKYYETDIKDAITNIKIIFLFSKIKSKLMFTVLLNAFENHNIFCNKIILTSVMNFGIINGVEIEVVKRLLKKGAYINSTNVQGLSPLLQSIKSKRNVNFIKEIINLGANINEVCDKNKNTILHLAVNDCWNDNDFEMIKLLLDHGADTNSRNIKNELPLMKALLTANEAICFEIISRGYNYKETEFCTGRNGVLIYALSIRNRSKELIFQLITNGAFVNSTGHGNTPLHLALINDYNIDYINELLKHGANVNGVNSCGESPLLTAMKHKREKEIILLLIENGANINYVGNDNTVTPLIYAINNDDYKDIIDKLLDLGVNINYYGYDRVRPLMHALKRYIKDVIFKLINLGALVNVRDKNGLTPLHYAVIYCSDDEIVNFLINKGADVNAVNECRNQIWYNIKFKPTNDDKFFSEIVINKHNINVEDSYGRTFIEFAFELKLNKDIIFNILYNNANINSVGKTGRTPLICAINNNCDLDIIIKLIECKADVNLCDIHGMTPLMHASRSFMYKDIIKLLIDYEADVNISDNDGRTLLFYILENINDKKVVSFVINRGTDVNLIDNKGVTLLMSALSSPGGPNLDIISFLIENGADVNASDNYGKTVLDIMFENKNYFTFNTLLEHGACIKKCSCFSKLICAKNHIEELIKEDVDWNIVVELLYNIDFNLDSDVSINLCQYMINFIRFKGLAILLMYDCVNILKNDVEVLKKYLFSMNHIEFIRILIQYGVDINYVNNNDESFLMYALSKKKKTKFIKQILYNGGNTKFINKKLLTPLHYAHSEEIIDFLIVYGNIDISYRNRLNIKSYYDLYSEDYKIKCRNRVFIKHLLLISSEELSNVLFDIRYNHFKNKCMLEIDFMKYKNIFNDVSFNKFFYKLSKYDKYVISKTDYKLNYTPDQIKLLFPIYASLIILKIDMLRFYKYINLIKRNLILFTLNNLVIDYDTFYCIFKYLKNKDIVNLFFASLYNDLD